MNLLVSNSSPLLTGLFFLSLLFDLIRYIDVGSESSELVAMTFLLDLYSNESRACLIFFLMLY